MAIVDTRMMFRPVSSGLVSLLREIPADAWSRPTIAGSWMVRDIVAHLIDLTFRRLSFHRDRMPPPHSGPINSESDFVAFINGLNRDFVEATRRFSPEVLTDLFEKGSHDLAGFFEQLPLSAPALFSVSWAGEQTSAGWFDIGREFTELWHHQAQIRLAVGAEPLQDPQYLHAVLLVALRGLPHAYRAVAAQTGASIAIEIGGRSGGVWALVREPDRWTLQAGHDARADATVSLSDENAWRLLFNALPEAKAAAVTTIEGDSALALPFLRARSVIV